MNPLASDFAKTTALVAGLVALAAVVLVACWLIRRTLLRVPRQYRQTSPSLVWLLFVPMVNLVWAFILAVRVPASIRAGLDAQGSSEGGDCGRGVGLAWAISWALAAALGVRGRFQESGLSPAGGWLGFGSVVLLAIFIVQSSAASKKLLAK